MGRSDNLKMKLEQEFSPSRLEIINESHLHAGHHHGDETYDGSGETHLRIRIVSDAFAGMSRVERHRAINALAAEEIAAGLHALAIEAKTPAEA
ncbi:MAG: BolA family transcriptional regulator [Salaquimonas sp.]|jgi:BolA protein|nr:BolA family transcriptional regulator [Salaquimonas sp.]